MFTGLVQAVGVVRAVEARPAGVRLAVDTAGWAHVAGVGDSISVSGCCLTVAAPPSVGAPPPRGRLEFDVVPETLAKTTLGGLRAGSRVNLEHSVTPSTLMGGHIVQGHVDGVGEVVEVAQGAEYRVRIRPGAGSGGEGGLMEYVSPKGSVAVDGVSLTVAALGADWLEVALIPRTLEKTTLGELRAGSRCNLEMDILAKTVVHWLRTHGERGAGNPLL